MCRVTNMVQCNLQGAMQKEINQLNFPAQSSLNKVLVIMLIFCVKNNGFIEQSARYVCRGANFVQQIHAVERINTNENMIFACCSYQEYPIKFYS